jgi:hypothetical protein
MRADTRRWSLWIGIALAVSGFLAPSASAAAPAYGPAGSRFSIAFPSPPTPYLNSKVLRSTFRTAQSVRGYALAPGHLNVFADKDIPPPPTDAVVVIQMRTMRALNQLLTSASKIPGIQSSRVGTLRVLEALEPENEPSNPPSHITDASAWEGFLFAHHAKTIFLVETVADNEAAASAFLATFQTRR